MSVLLYCWHSYSSRIGTGLWFASMNYSVHSMMYFYFGLTQTGPRGKALARRFSMAITSLQLAQMVVGIAVTVASMVYHASGAVCHVSLVNSLLGLAMYVSYFLLFLQLFLRSYVWKTHKPETRAGARQQCAGQAVGARAGAARGARGARCGGRAAACRPR